MNRRQFTKQTIMVSAAVSTAAVPGFSEILLPPERKIKKGMMWGGIRVGTTIMEKFQAAKLAGFDGVETDSHLERDQVLKAMQATGLPVASVCGSQHWKSPLSHPDAEVRAQGLEALRVTLEDAKAYGADTVLLVPGRVLDTVSYDDCWNRTTEEIRKIIPVRFQQSS
jgi:hexulose-6-phosphate isomerase